MYCSSCGNQLKKGLRYCNSCGARIADTAEEKKSLTTGNLTSALRFIGVAGFLGFLGLVKILLDSRIDQGLMITILFAYLAAFCLICVLLIKQISGRSERSAVDTQLPNDIPSAEVKAAQTNSLEDTQQTPASVTENTTQKLDNIPVERK